MTTIPARPTSPQWFLPLLFGGAAWLVWLAGQGGWERVFGFLMTVVVMLAARGETTRTLVWWLATSPFLSYFARFPVEQSVVTFDRLMVVLVALCCLRDAAAGRIALRIGLFETLWAGFCALTLLDLAARGGSSAFAWKTGVDAFCLPLVAFVAARRGTDVREIGWLPVVLLGGLALLLLPVGLYEFLFQRDLFQYAGGSLIRDEAVRATGPFLADNSYALVSLVLAILVWHWPALAGLTETRRQEMFRWCATLAAFGSSALPLFRAVWATAVGCVAFPAYLAGDAKRRRRIVFAGLALVIVAGAGGWLVSQTRLYRSRLANPENVYTRLATYQAAWMVFEDHWATGVGLTRYTEEYNRRYYNEDDYNRKYPTVGGEIPRNSPHNNVLAVLAELGIVTGTLYVLAHLALLAEGLLLCAAGDPTKRTVGRVLLTLWLAYWIPGMTLASGYYADLNFYFFAACGLTLGAVRRIPAQVRS